MYRYIGGLCPPKRGVKFFFENASDIIMKKHIKIHMSTNFYDFGLHWKILGAILANRENRKNDINKKINKILTIYLFIY